jgi:hypothetical protein
MGAAGKAFTFVTPEQGDELTKVEALINMVIPQAKLEGFESRPAPDDWTTEKPSGDTPSAPVQSRFERPYSPVAAASSDSPPVVLQAPPRTIGSKIPINRRHKRRR